MIFSPNNVDLIIKTLGYDHYELFPTFNHTGGLWVLWHFLNIDVAMMVKEVRAIHCYVFDKSNAQHFVLSDIYAPA